MTVGVPAAFDRELLMSVTGLPELVVQRREFLYRNLRHEFSSTLEIGALNSPTIRPGECQTQFLDWFHTDELRARHLDNPRVDVSDLVPVDHVIKSRDFADHIEDPVDLLIANHVVEHVPDPIYWFEQAGRCVKPDGRLFLCVPDRQYTFDYFRRESDAVEMIGAYQEKRERPTAADIARHLYYLTDITHTEIWETGPPLRFKPRMDFAEALSRARSLAEVYTDVHVWVFTSVTFRQTIHALRESGHLEWEIEAFEDVKPGQNEMRILLHKT
jgi:SAM-dependent methyltransferase